VVVVFSILPSGSFICCSDMIQFEIIQFENVKTKGIHC